ncbi:phosphomannose isomerase [Lachnospiraceae bacterium JC7]|nr:phosphomannose isomerase [Lachnospiraceae bacterium JC7]
MYNNELLFMTPFLKEVLWGGTRLQEKYGYKSDSESIGEAWVVSANRNGESRVRDGHFKGMTLSELWSKQPELFGPDRSDSFPLLVKLIYARDNLSIQVHPDDDYAYVHENGGSGKTECWYIADCEEGADIIIGHNAKNKEELREMVTNGEWDKLLRVIPIHKGDFFYIPSGTVHAIRKGTLLLETQQNCDLTYRLYDYDRLQNGKPRELHIDKAIDVINYPSDEKDTANVSASPSHDLSTGEATAHEELLRCSYFSVDKYLVKDSLDLTQSHSFLIVDVLEGSGTVDGIPVGSGDNFIAPYNYGELHFEGDMTIITSHI